METSLRSVLLCLAAFQSNCLYKYLTGREYTIPSPLQRFLAEIVDFFILFCVKATVVLWIIHLSGMK